MNPALARRAAAAFARRFGRRAAAVAFAPGRVNLIGDHTDYQGGLSLPMAIAQGVAAAAAARPDGLWQLAADGRDALAPIDGRALAAGGPAAWRGPAGGWARLIAGALVEGGVRAGLDLYLTADLAEGAGLSSSAAACLAALAAASAALGVALGREAACAACQRAENLWLGVPSGRMDQLAIAFGRPGHAVRVDAERLTAEPVPFDPAADGWRLWRIDLGVRRTLGQSGYEARRAESEAAARALGVPRLCALTPAALAAHALAAPLDRRARHIVSENARVEAALAAARARDWPAVARLFSASHASLRDDYESSHPTLDAVVDALSALRPPVAARVTGGGFGGSLVALGLAGQEAAVAAAAARAGADPAGAVAEVRASAGLGRWSAPGATAPGVPGPGG